MAVARKIQVIEVSRKVEYFTLDATQAAAKEVFLNSSPVDPTNVNLDIPAGTPQVLDFDFEVDGARIFWAGKALETCLSEGDTIRVTYD